MTPIYDALVKEYDEAARARRKAEAPIYEMLAAIYDNRELVGLNLDTGQPVYRSRSTNTYSSYPSRLTNTFSDAVWPGPAW